MSEREDVPAVAGEGVQRVRLRAVPLPPVSPAGLANITLGVRKKRSTQSVSNRLRKHAAAELAAAWDGTTPFEKTLLLLLAEHKTLSAPQIKAFFALPAKQPRVACEGLLASLEERYGTELPPDRVFTAKSQEQVYTKAEKLKRKGLVASVHNATNNLIIDKALAPSLLSVHYFLTEMGAQTVATVTGTPLSFVANYETYAFDSLLHLSEVNDFFVSSIAAAQDLMNNHPDEAGILDVTSWLHESRTEHQFEIYAGRTIKFRSDGMMTLFSSLREDFTDFYLEHDTGRMPAEKIRTKTAAYLHFVLYRKAAQMAGGEPFRRPVLLFVTTSETRVALYRENIARAVAEGFPQRLDYANAFGRIAVASAEDLKGHSPLGEAWRVMDLGTGRLSKERFNLLTISW